MKVFLGGTCNESTWRDELIKMLKIDYYSPVVPSWTSECQAEEIRQREICDYVLYVITPKMTGVYSIAEVVDDSNKRPRKTVFCVLEKDGDLAFNEGQLKSLDAVGHMVLRNGGAYLHNLQCVAEFVNGGGWDQYVHVERGPSLLQKLKTIVGNPDAAYEKYLERVRNPKRAEPRVLDEEGEDEQ